MHCVCLGVMRKLLNTWLGPDKAVKLNGKKIIDISNYLTSTSSCIPLEINRKPRSLSDLPRWKATEFRTFLLYVGPVALHRVINSAIYEHFLLLHSSITILISEKFISKFMNLARTFINTFVKHSEHIYGEQFIIYNVHMLCHLCDDVTLYGVLDSFSAFCFENYLGQLKRLIKKPSKPLQQLCRRLGELHQNADSFITSAAQTSLFLAHVMGPLIPKYNFIQVSQFKKVIYDDLTLIIHSYSVANSYCLVEDNEKIKVVEVQNILSSSVGVEIIGKQFHKFKSFYSYPFDSQNLHIYRVFSFSTELYSWPLQNVIAKCIALPYLNNEKVIFPLLHTV
ncbi:hypothetical protein PPYR_13914 [Photinus pyralis]|uniref:DUF4218 domain-containing protein n=1 Tax=Photinus pyralis TaxID=7054 RepID=A0A5N4A3Q3_PHOPY|nr:hypothetical protein PPYR_13914 [Photinus pyralis]